MRTPLRTVAALTLLAAAMSGCHGSSATFPFERETVWRAAVGEATVWAPNRIDTEKYIIESTKTDLVSERHYELSVTRDPNLFARRPSTKVHVRMRQTQPRGIEFTRLEREFLIRLRAKLEVMVPPPPTQ